MNLLFLVVALAASAFALSSIRRFFARRRFAASHGCKPVKHRDNIDPILGLDIVYILVKTFNERRALEYSRSRFEKRGTTTFTSRRLFTPTIITIEPENIKAILSLQFKEFGIGHRLETFGPLLGKGIFDTDGDHWQASRALIRPNFNREQVADLKAFEDLMPGFFALIPGDGKTMVDLQDIFFKYTIDSATEFLFGQSVNSLKMGTSELGFAPAFTYSVKSISLRGVLGPLNHIYRDKKEAESNRICREFAKRFVDEAVQAAQDEEKAAGSSDEKSGKYVFAHELAKRTSDKTRILDELMNVLLAGRDTTASLLSNMFFMLAKHPKIWAKLRNEVAELNGKPPTYKQLQDLKYLKHCMNESLRLHPVVPQNEREAMQDTTIPLGGGEDGLSPVFVPKGTLVGYHVYSMHRRKDYYGEDADEFRPERWEDGKLQPRWEYLPFNGGPRICIGQKYALTEAAYVTVRLAQEYETLTSMDPEPWTEGLSLTLCSHNGTKVCLTPVKK